ncbi:hypothetical protein KY333_00775 [Candidatus Woesearchaeota archaeon]|nr:hypothetical protein [Candidatus Woesearchaeota archaeon]MBW2994601.1 hypothetical protein [Candidatus Woesearchaeota archaeon]
MKKRVTKSIFSTAIIGWIACVLYMTGLAFLVPLISIILFPPDFFMTPPNLGVLTLVAVALVVISAVILTKCGKSLGTTLFYLGHMSFIVGIIAAIFLFIGKKQIISALSFLGKLEPVAAGYVAYWDYFVPKVWASIIIYFGVAIALWVIGARIKKREIVTGVVKNVYGGRARIVR